MRLNKFLASGTGLSRRKADDAIIDGRVAINGRLAHQGMDVVEADIVTLDGKSVTPTTTEATTVMLNKPRGYVVSRVGQGSKTVYELLPAKYQQLIPVGRLDKDSSGLLLFTNDGQLAHKLTHPSHEKTKVYEITLDKPLQPLHRQMIHEHGLQLEDGLSRLQLERLSEDDDIHWTVRMHEGRNRQIRRTFAALGYNVQVLHRTRFGSFNLGELSPGRFLQLTHIL
ncbi:MAG TPA: pseudouridine synthase [Verrucomicrobiae bacterium]|nr:pseudouridine synthase [Verrucomicrobiae bacterium]